MNHEIGRGLADRVNRLKEKIDAEGYKMCFTCREEWSQRTRFVNGMCPDCERADRDERLRLARRNKPSEVDDVMGYIGETE